eukprot:scaffold10215_cov90-Isochrysis_galbana.AAC.1
MHVRAELDVLSEADENPWLVKLAVSFQDEENLYLVRCMGGVQSGGAGGCWVYIWRLVGQAGRILLGW